MIAIKEMKMPKSCWDCPILCKENGQCEETRKYIDGNDIPRDCPLVEIQERRVGEWVIKDNGNGGMYVECPFCGALAPCTEFADKIVWRYSKFCYDCGSELSIEESIVRNFKPYTNQGEIE